MVRAHRPIRRCSLSTIDLLGIAWQIFRCADSTADVMIAKDIPGTDNHEDRDAGIQVLKKP
jgi:hypothetical protein